MTSSANLGLPPIVARARGSVGMLPIACLLACGPDIEVEGSVDGRDFLSERSLVDGAPQVPAALMRYSLYFEEDGSGFAADASGGCNVLLAAYAVEADTLVLTEATHTIAGCNGPRADVDERYFAFLTSRPSVDLHGHALVLEGGGLRIEYLDAAVASPDLSIRGHRWVVDAIIVDGLVTHVDGPDPASLSIGLDSRVVIDTGCNTGSGTLDESRYTGSSFADVSLTSHPCEGEAARLEDAVRSVLHSPEALLWTVARDRLWLAGGGVELDLVARDG